MAAMVGAPEIASPGALADVNAAAAFLGEGDSYSPALKLHPSGSEVFLAESSDDEAAF
jgi:hypothetical protein